MKSSCLKLVVGLLSVVLMDYFLSEKAPGQRASNNSHGVVSNVKWNEASVDYSAAGKRFRFDFSTNVNAEQ